MTFPDWWAVTLIALAAYRLYRIVGEDKITERPRHWVLYELEFRKEGRGSYWNEFIECPWCAGFWISGLLLLLYAALEGWWNAGGFVVTWLAISSLVGLLAGTQALIDRHNG